MISLDYSILPAILVFLATIWALNSVLFQPLLRVMAEREAKTTGLVARADKQKDHYLDLSHQYQETLKSARMEGYRHQEQERSQALEKRAGILGGARKNAEQLIDESRAAIQVQVQAAKEQLNREAQDVARSIARTILQRSA